jgi:glycosyltransferase involved in cell wall biosynthesis
MFPTRASATDASTCKRGNVVKPPSNPRILYVSPPWAYKSIRSLHLADALRHVGSVDRVIVHAEREKGEGARDEGKGFNIAYELDVHPRPVASLIQRTRSALDPRVPFPHGIAVDDEGNRRVLQTLQDYDLIWFFKLRTANMFGTWNWPRSVLDIDDLPSGFHESVLGSSSSTKEKLRAWTQCRIWRRRESLMNARFTTLTVCSEADRARLRVNLPVHIIPNGFELPKVDPERRPATPVRFGFIGLFDYFANREGVQWFVEKCWPLIIHHLPEARLRLVGRGSDGAIWGATPGVDCLGWVEDSAAEIATWSAMIIPLHKGGGTRVKIAESFSRKCPIVSTRIGAYGYDVTDGKQLRLADSAEEFVRACIDLVREPEEAARMAERAWTDFVGKWTWDAIAPRVWAAAEDCLRRSGRQGPPPLTLSVG